LYDDVESFRGSGIAGSEREAVDTGREWLGSEESEKRWGGT
jgi:hypothetical protein